MAGRAGSGPLPLPGTGRASRTRPRIRPVINVLESLLVRPARTAPPPTSPLPPPPPQSSSWEPGDGDEALRDALVARFGLYPPKMDAPSAFWPYRSSSHDDDILNLTASPIPSDSEDGAVQVPSRSRSPLTRPDASPAQGPERPSLQAPTVSIQPRDQPQEVQQELWDLLEAVGPDVVPQQPTPLVSARTSPRPSLPPPSAAQQPQSYAAWLQSLRPSGANPYRLLRYRLPNGRRVNIPALRRPSPPYPGSAARPSPLPRLRR